MQKKTNERVIRYKNFDPVNFEFPKDNKRNDFQEYKFVSYKVGDRNISPLIQTPQMTLTTYGIPDAGMIGYETDKKRSFIKVPLNSGQNKHGQASKQEEEFLKFLKSVDDYLSSTEVKNSLLGGASKAKKYVYSPLVKEPVELDDEPDKDDTEEYEKWQKRQAAYRPLFFKPKLSVELEGEDVTSVKTAIKVINEDGKKETIEVKSIDDIKKYVRFGCKMKLLLSPCKLWIARNPMNGAKVKLYGLTLKIFQMEVVPSEGGTSEKIDPTQDLMISDSDDEEQNNDNTLNDSESSDEDDSESD